jgi:hypothetical protein
VAAHEFPIPSSVQALLDETADGKVGVIVGAHGGAQSSTGNLAPDLIPPEALLAIADVVGRGAKKYATNNWRRIPMQEQVRHALIHLYKHMAGDRTEKHLWNALTRLAFAVAVESDYDYRAYHALPEPSKPSDPSRAPRPPKRRRGRPRKSKA